MLNSSFQVFPCGLAGGAVLELLHWYNIRRDPQLPAYARSPFYWVITILMTAAGGGLPSDFQTAQSIDLIVCGGRI